MSVIIINEQKLNIFYDRPDFLVFSLSTMIFLNNLIQDSEVKKEVKKGVIKGS